MEFSPTGDRLYATGTYEVPTPQGNHFTGFIFQFNSSLPSQMQIQNSRFFLDSTYNFRAGAIQLANNGKMYVNIQDNLSEIGDPENLGAACSYTRFAVQSGSSNPNLNLPAFLQSYLRYPIIATGNCQFQNISFNIQNPFGISSMSWNFGDPASGVNNVSNSFVAKSVDLPV